MKKDTRIFDLIAAERSRQMHGIELIASENFVSDQVMEAMGSVLTNKYAEGYPGARYYGGCEVVDKVETLAIERICRLYGAEYANVQPHSGAQANMAVFFACMQPGDTFMGLDLAHGGHLSHGSPVNMSGKYFNAVGYQLDEATGVIDYDAMERKALECKPKVIVGGASAYSREWDYKRMRAIADKVGALLLVDMAHTAGLIAAGLLDNPVKYAHIVTSTTHKTLRGPRGGIILMGKDFENPWGLTTPKGAVKMMSQILNSAVFPGIQGGPLEHVIAAKAVAFGEALAPEYKEYQAQVQKNAKAMAEAFVKRGYKIVSGGTDKISYSLGGGYMNQRGIMIANDDAERFSWDMKINAQVTKRLRVGVSLLGNLRYNTDPIYGVSTTVNIINRALPIFGTQLPDGKWLSTWLSTPGRNNPENPLMYLNEGNTRRQYHRILGRINIGYDLPWGIKYNANLGYVKIDHYSKDFKHAMYTYNPKTLERKDFSAYVSAKDWDNNSINYTFYNTLSWGKCFGGSHNFNVMVGTEYKRYDAKNFQAKKRDYFNNQLTALSVGATMDEISGGSSLELLFSYFGRITYDYKEKYLIDVTARYDGSSKFAKGNRWAFFPAVSVGWRIDKESFMQNIRQINVLKLRGSVGEMGNQAIGNYEYLMSVLASKDYNYSFSDVLAGGAAIKDFVDENISWETTRTYNLGLDFEAFDHRLLFSVDLYKKRTEGILRDVKIPAQIGNLNGPKQNIGVVANDGIELNLQWRSTIKNFHYSLGGNFCYNKNIVVDLDGQEYIKTFNIIREGEPIDAWYLYQADGFYNSYEEIANSVTVGSGVKPGYIRYKNLNNDDKIDNDDRAVCGNLTPSITYAFNFSLGWKGLELSAQFQGVADVKTYLSGNLAAPFWNGAGVLKEWATDAWTPENHNTRLPILHTATGAPEMHDYKNTQWLYNASYLRCKQLQLSYTLPKKWISKLGMSQCQIFVNGENLFTISPLKMFDPEIDLSSTNLMQYPSLRTINFGFNITF